MRRSVAERGTHRVARWLCMLLLLVLLSLLLLSQVARSARAVGREKITAATFGTRHTHEAYLFRDEQTVTSRNNGAVEYLVAEGAAVAKGQELARVFTDSSDTGRRAQAAVLYDEIERLERASDQTTAWQKGYVTSYDAMMCALSAGNWGVGTAAAATLGASLEQRSTEGDTQAVETRIAELREELHALLLYEDEPIVALADMAGYFCREADGYEALFGTDAAKGLTPEKLRGLIGARVAPAPEAVGKLVSGDGFYLAVLTDAERASDYVTGTVYPVAFGQGGTVKMLLEEISHSANADEAVLVLSAERLPASLSTDRRQTVVIEVGHVDGLCVPRGAIEEENGEFAVYVLLDGVARRRRVEVLCTEGGCCLVTPSIDEEYVREGDLVLITLRNIYDGKVLYR